jgi:hypothetical protein
MLFLPRYLTIQQCIERELVRLRTALSVPDRALDDTEHVCNRLAVTAAIDSLSNEFVSNALHERSGITRNPAAFRQCDLVE